jgi:predicted ATP-dependent endonuclease of OLD family
LQNGTDYYIQKTIEDILEKKDRAGLSLTYRKLREAFSEEDSIKSINERLKESRDIIVTKNLTVTIDISQRTNWEANLTSCLDEIPYQYIGKGDQNILKMIFALQRKKAKESHVILIEEPENHLSFSTMNKLVNMISDKCKEKQLIIATHSAFVLNKLGIEKMILLSDELKTMSLKDLSDDTQKYFKKLPGYDTLRLVLAKKSILVEGPSDELFVQKAYLQKNGRLPINDGVDVISVKGLSAKRFLEIAKSLKKTVAVVTDNDGNPAKVKVKYKDYLSEDNIKICYDDADAECKTLELQIAKYNDLKLLNRIFGSSYASKEDLVGYMLDNKTESALRLFETKETITIPPYVEEAIQ